MSRARIVFGVGVCLLATRVVGLMEMEMWMVDVIELECKKRKREKAGKLRKMNKKESRVDSSVLCLSLSLCRLRRLG